MHKRYRVLRLLGTIYKMLGILTGLITLMIAVGACVSILAGGAAFEQVGRQLGQEYQAISMISGVLSAFIALIGVIYGTGIALALYAAGELIDLLIALETNTRTTAWVLQQQHKAQTDMHTTAPLPGR